MQPIRGNVEPLSLQHRDGGWIVAFEDPAGGQSQLLTNREARDFEQADTVLSQAQLEAKYGRVVPPTSSQACDSGARQPAWYHDPSDPLNLSEQLRWFDGYEWTAYAARTNRVLILPLGPPPARLDDLCMFRFCMICGRPPAVPLLRRRQTAFLVGRFVTSDAGPLCRDCGIGLVRADLNHSLLFGWWGLISFFANFGVVTGLAGALVRCKQLPAPAGTAQLKPAGPGRPLWARAIGYVLLVLALYGVAYGMALGIFHA